MEPVKQRGLAVFRHMPLNGHMAEVGVLVGKLSNFVLSHRSDIRLTMVDSWAPSCDQPEQYKRTGDTHAFHDQARVDMHKREALRRVAPYSDRTRILHMASLEAASQVEDGSLDLVFLDADHSYEGVCEDIRAWLPKVRKGGFIGGHDYQNDNAGFKFGVTEAVDKWAGSTGRDIETDLNFTWFARV